MEINFILDSSGNESFQILTIESICPKKDLKQEQFLTDDNLISGFIF